MLELTIRISRAPGALEGRKIIMCQKDDLINRQAAIDAVAPFDDEYRIRDAIEDLPSAQPEIIRCRDCKHCRRERSEESAKKFGQIYYCARNVFSCQTPDDFCSRAERREVGE